MSDGKFTFASCSYLDKEPDTEIDVDMVFASKTKVESWLANVYSRIPNPGIDWLNNYGWEILQMILHLLSVGNNGNGKIYLKFLENGLLILSGVDHCGIYCLRKFVKHIFLMNVYMLYQVMIFHNRKSIT